MGPLARGGSEEVSWTQCWPGLIRGKIQASLQRQPPVAKRELWGNSGKHGNWKSCDIQSKCYDICGPRNGAVGSYLQRITEEPLHSPPGATLAGQIVKSLPQGW